VSRVGGQLAGGRLPYWEPSPSAVLRGGAPSRPDFWNLPLDDLLQALQTSPSGLSEDEATRRLRLWGPNETSLRRHYRALGEAIRLLLNPLVLILLLASGIAALLGDLAGSSIIATIVAISLALDFAQSHRSQDAARRLAESVAATATVRRDGQLAQVPFRTLVPGDVVELKAGDLVPADCRLLHTRFLAVNQAALTGESLPVGKEACELPTAVREAGAAVNAVFLGSAIVSGEATALVVRTGPATELGHIGRVLESRSPATEFERGMHAFAALIARTVAALVALVFLINTLYGRSTLESFLFAVALAVGLTPEFLPMIVTVTLGEAALRMARKRVIVRHLQAIHNLGAMDTLCSDKTGTLTEGAVQVAATFPCGADPVLLTDLAVLNATLVSGFRNPLDEAIARLPNRTIVPTYQKVDELSFDFNRRRVSVIVRAPDGQHLLIAKGAPESVLAACDYRDLAGRPVPLGPDDRAEITALFQEQGTRGYRCLAVAYRVVEARGSYRTEDEQGLRFVGLICFADPPVEGVAGVIEGLRQRGIALKILTGDDPLIARHVCAEVGLPVDRVLLGADVDGLDDVALGAIAEKVTLFARLTPIQKNRIIGALKRRGHVVGFLGDGINDAPSLHAADVGISVAGASAVAREAAEIILLERSLAVLQEGVDEGRTCFGNTLKYVMMGTSSNFGNMFSMVGATLIFQFLPMLPVQILLNNLLYDLGQLTLPGDNVDPELIERPRRWDGRLVRNFMLVFGPISSLFDFLTFGVLWFGLHASPAVFRTGWFMESLATQVLAIYVIRTMRAPWRSRPSRGLVVSTLGAVGVGLILPLLPMGALVGFVSPPPVLYLFTGVTLAAYLSLVELVKRWFYGVGGAASSRAAKRYPTPGSVSK
jgi:Mg2+-importing ATPase